MQQIQPVKKKKVKGRFMGPFNTAAFGLLYSYPNKFPHSSPEAPRTIEMRGPLPAKAGSITNEFC
jgi:hypothetical protein